MSYNKVPNNLVLIDNNTNLTCSRRLKVGDYYGNVSKYTCNKLAVYSNGVNHYCKQHSLKQRYRIKTINPIIIHGQQSYNMENSKILHTFDTKEEALIVFNELNDNILLSHNSKSHRNIIKSKFKNTP